MSADIIEFPRAERLVPDLTWECIFQAFEQEARAEGAECLFLLYGTDQPSAWKYIAVNLSAEELQAAINRVKVDLAKLRD